MKNDEARSGESTRESIRRDEVRREDNTRYEMRRDAVRREERLREERMREEFGSERFRRVDSRREELRKFPADVRMFRDGEDINEEEREEEMVTNEPYPKPDPDIISGATAGGGF